jgi:hypothetical protein
MLFKSVAAGVRAAVAVLLQLSHVYSISFYDFTSNSFNSSTGSYTACYLALASRSISCSTRPARARGAVAACCAQPAQHPSADWRRSPLLCGPALAFPLSAISARACSSVATTARSPYSSCSPAAPATALCAPGAPALPCVSLAAPRGVQGAPRSWRAPSAPRT